MPRTVHSALGTGNVMLSEFSRSGISLRYPSNWTLESEEAGPEGWTASFHSPRTAFILLSLRPDARDPADLADQTLAALKSEYKELDAEDRVETIAGRMAIGHDIDFLTVDTANVCRTRCLDTPDGPLLVMCQASEYDREETDPVLRAVVKSMRIEEE
jgi:hypothetical protein